MIYLDTSALMKLVREETESTALHEWLVTGRPSPLFTSQLSITETKRALHAAGAEEIAATVAGTEPPAVVVPGHQVLALPLTFDLVSTAGDLEPGTGLRSLDALHLATALEAGPDLTTVVTYDKRMQVAANALGLRTAAPQAPADEPGNG